mmetsp:Transcript_95976/g.271531  ORF Transcript_95976/g.271531 Transcript_95976/m.271531 type:complete len:244 (+) Transcript_95976:629-1360(+)
MQQPALPAKDVVRQNVRGGIHGAVQDEVLHKLWGLVHGVLLEEFVALGIVVNLLRLAPGRDLRLLRLIFLLLGALVLVFLLKLLLFAHFDLLVGIVHRRARHRVTTGFLVVKLHVNPYRVLGGTTVKLVRVEALLHAEHRDVRLQRGFPQTIIVEVELILRNVVEMLKSLAEFLQGLAKILLPVIAPTDSRFVPHALHVMQIRSIWCLGLLRVREKEGLFHARLHVVYPEIGSHALRVEEAVR